jgi:hypothetical protein
MESRGIYYEDTKALQAFFHEKIDRQADKSRLAGAGRAGRADIDAMDVQEGEGNCRMGWRRGEGGGRLGIRVR